MDQSQVPKVLKQVLGKPVPFDRLQLALKEVRPSADGYTQEQLMAVIGVLEGKSDAVLAPLKKGGPRHSPASVPASASAQSAPSSSPVLTKRTSVMRVGGATEGSQHSFDAEEVAQFILHINGLGYELDPSNPATLFECCQDGLILAALINDAVPDTIDTRVLNVGSTLNPFQMTENNNLVIGSAQAIGCRIVNIGSADLIEGREHLVLGLIWQIIRTGLLARINLHLHPELARLLAEGETLEDFLRLPAEAILLRWVNYHLARSSRPTLQLGNLSLDVRSGEAYCLLLHQLAQTGLQGLSLSPAERAELIVGQAERLGVGRYITAAAILTGHPRLNLAWIAHLFNRMPGLEALTADEQANLELLEEGEGSREARVICLWMNSLGVEPYVHSLAGGGELRNGRVLLQLYDAIRPGTVDWRRVNGAAGAGEGSRFKWLENCNYAVQLGLAWGFSLVGIQGADLVDGNATLTLALCWQLMRQHLIDTIAKHGKRVTELDILQWANANSGGDCAPLHSLRDPALADGRFLLSLLNTLRPGLIDLQLWDPTAPLQNARYVLSAVRKLGGSIFLLPEDIVEVKPRLIFTLLATLMALVDK